MKRICPLLNLKVLTAALSLMILLGCASASRPPESILDTPDLYVSNGFLLIKKSCFDDAEREFNTALRYDPKNSGAYAGLALAMGYKGENESALTSMKRSASLAKSAEEEYRVHVGWIRLYAAMREEGWLKESEKAYAWACSFMKNSPDAHYYMGLAYKQGYRINEARATFLKVLEIKKSLVREAEIELGTLRKIENARPVSEFGRKVVVEEHVTRADLAALFFHELKVHEILKKQEQKGADPRAPAEASDMARHPLRSSVGEVLRLNIKGLTIYTDGTFCPKEFVTRSAFSVILADIISRSASPTPTSGRSVKASPFSDVKSDAPYLGAIHLCRSWGVKLEAENRMFNPMGILAGYDAVLSIQKIKEKLKPL